MDLRAAIRRCLPTRWRHASGGTLPPYRPDDDSVPVLLAPGYAHIPPELRATLTSEQLDMISQRFQGGVS